MDPSCLEHCLTEEEQLAFERDGFFQVPEVVPIDLVRRLEAATDRIELPPDPRESYLLLDFIGRDDAFLELLDWPLTFPKVWGILGWHIQLYHSHVVVTPPLSEENRRLERRLGWHQDTGRLNIELDGNPRPRVSLKVAYFLTDTSQPHRGNFTVVPGSHLRNELELPGDGSDPPGATEIRAKPGDAVFFDRRLWHAAGRNRSEHHAQGAVLRVQLPLAQAARQHDRRPLHGAQRSRQAAAARCRAHRRDGVHLSKGGGRAAAGVDSRAPGRGGGSRIVAASVYWRDHPCPT